MSEVKCEHIQNSAENNHNKNQISLDLSNITRLLLRSHRHDIAGRVQAVWGLAELFDCHIYNLPAEINDAIEFLNNMVKAWREELSVLDLLIDGTPNLTIATTDQIRKVLVSDCYLPESNWHCDPIGLSASIHHAYKAIGRTGYQQLHTIVEVAKHIVIEIRAGDEGINSERGIHETANLSVGEVFAGDIDAALAEAHAHLSGIIISGYYTDSRAGIRLEIRPT